MTTNRSARRDRRETQSEDNRSEFVVPNWELIHERTLELYREDAKEPNSEQLPAKIGDFHLWGITEVDDRPYFLHAKQAYKSLKFARHSVTLLVQLHGMSYPVMIALPKDEAFVSAGPREEEGVVTGGN